MTSVFAQPDSESEELLKCGMRPFWSLQELTIPTVSFHISYRCIVTAELCMCMCVFKCSIWQCFEEPSIHLQPGVNKRRQCLKSFQRVIKTRVIALLSITLFSWVFRQKCNREKKVRWRNSGVVDKSSGRWLRRLEFASCMKPEVDSDCCCSCP